MTSDGERWSQWLRAALRKKGMTPAELSRKSGTGRDGQPVIRPDVISRWLNKGAIPKRQFVEALASALGVSRVDVLLAAGYLVPGDSYSEVDAQGRVVSSVTNGGGQTVGADSDAADDDNVLRYFRPPGISDAAWHRIRNEGQAYLEYQLDKAARER